MILLTQGCEVLLLLLAALTTGKAVVAEESSTALRTGSSGAMAAASGRGTTTHLSAEYLTLLPSKRQAQVGLVTIRENHSSASTTALTECAMAFRSTLC